MTRLTKAPELAFMAMALLLAGCGEKKAQPDSRDLPATLLADGANWPSGGRDYSEQNFSPLEEITEASVGKLGLAWSLDLEGEHSLEATPLAIDGILYFSGQQSKVYAVDAVSGKTLWTYDPRAGEADPTRLRYVFSVNRGLAYLDGKLFVGTIDGRLIAIDAKTGQPVWSTMTIDKGSKRTVTGAPRAYGKLVLIGNGGGDYGERGYLAAYNVDTGKQVWRFYTVPGSPEENAGDPTMEMAAKTWAGEYWKTGTGGTVWNGFTYDPELNRVYIGTGNSGPYNPATRSPGNGDNLFLVSIVAVDADTGKYIWHYQLNPREAWDYKAAAGIQMATIAVDGKPRKVLMQAPTNGFFYVLDRLTGKLISAEKYGKATWAEKIDLATGRPVEAPNIRYENGPVTIWPGPWGAHNWQPMSFSAKTGLVYIPYMQIGATYSIDKSSAIGGTMMVPVVKDKEDGAGKLIAWDPVAQKARWSVPLNGFWNGGVLSTGGNLVFQGIEDGTFNAYNAATGAKVWTFDAGLGIIGAPISYTANGKQYISILVGYGGATPIGSSFIKGGWKYNAQPRRLLTFVLGGTAKLPETAPRDFTVQAVDDPKLVIDTAAALRGAGVYAAKNCIVCHGANGVSPGSPAPDLRESGIAFDKAGFAQFLKAGSASALGMPAYPEITAQETDDLYMYIRARARDIQTPGAKPAGSAAHF